MSAASIARNASCPCGSGKRFKDCHGALGAAAVEPGTADELARQAQVRFAGNEPAAALTLLARALELAPERADLLRERARVEWTLGQARARTTCRAALELAPADAVAWNLLGEILSKSDAAAAEAAWREALRIDPRNAEALFHLGNRLREGGENEAAIDHFERSLQTAPGHSGALNNLGLALEAMGQAERAEACYRQVLAIQSQHADALANLANLLQGQKRYREAALAYEKAIAAQRDFPAEFWIARGIVLGELGAIADAEQSLREAAKREPDHMPTQVDIGSMCMLQQKYEEAEVFFSRALDLHPSVGYALGMLIHCRLLCCRWDGLDGYVSRLRHHLEPRDLEGDAPEARHNVVPFPLLALPLTPRQELEAARRWADDLTRRVARPAAGSFVASLPAPRPTVSRPLGARLRVGFVSSDFREHPMMSLLMECLERIDRTRLETFAYSLLPQDRGPLGQRIAHAFDRFVDCSVQAFEQIARRVAQDAIDVLIDLNGYTTYAKSEIFALRPAPVEISWLGYLGTLGAPWYDYVLTDRFLTPPAAQAHFTERFLYLPDCYCPSDTRRAVAKAAPTRAACGLPESGFVFCCFNAGFKILPQVFDVWMRLLTAAPGSVLWLSPGNATAQANLGREAAARGIDPTRLVFAPRIDLPEHLARHVHANLFLDTTPYNAGTTANDALFMGVPVLTCAGETMASRVAGSQLHAIGLPELVTTSLTDYEALALRLAREPQLLAGYRARLAAHRATHPLFDMDRFTRAFDELLLAAWENQPRAGL